MNVRYTPRARRDLEEIYVYIDLRLSEGARAVKGTIERRIHGLSEFPFMAPETDEAGSYELTIARYPYKIYYRVEKGEVWVVHIRHARRRPWDGKSQHV